MSRITQSEDCSDDFEAALADHECRGSEAPEQTILTASLYPWAAICFAIIPICEFAPHRHAHSWCLLAFLLGLGIGLALYGYLREARSREAWCFGSRIDRATNTLLWWDGPPAQPARAIRVASISSIAVGEDRYPPLFRIIGRSGETIRLPRKCIRDAVSWAKAMGRRYPHITVMVQDA